MDPEFWAERWRLGEIGFHRSKPNPLLIAHWPTVDAKRPANARVLVPLCGKTRDLHWLMAQRLQVTGIELDPIAVASFFAEWPDCSQVPPEPQITDSGHLLYHKDSLTLVQGDFFAWQPEEAYELFYDRASLIALPPSMRSDYLRHLYSLLKPDAHGLLMSYEYDQNQMVGPPFSVGTHELSRFPAMKFKPLTRAEVIQDHPGMQAKGLTSLIETAYHVTLA